ncbi:MAG: HpcH/HpaI aldolase/citrate lyase family protein [Candidatus Velthaea sp.]
MATLKDRLAAGRPILGLSVMFSAAPIVEMAGALGFDWVLLDCEHGALSVDGLEPLIAAADAAGVAAIVRRPDNRAETILRALDRGAAGLQLPGVMNAAEARDIVRAAKYFPDGERGIAVGTRSGGYGFRESAADTMERANRETLICVQIEHADALPHIEEIAAVDGVDVVFVGAMDLSQSLGFPAQTDAPAVKAAVDDALLRIVRTGKWAGTSGRPDAAAGSLALGVRYHYTHVTTLLGAAAAPYLALRER